jgi:hypothetical protein
MSIVGEKLLRLRAGDVMNVIGFMREEGVAGEVEAA